MCFASIFSLRSKVLRFIGFSIIISFFLGTVGLVHADERDALISKIVATSALPCGDEAIELMNLQLQKMEPDLVLQGMRQTMSLGDGWATGNPLYDQARGIITTVFDEDQAKNGRFFAYTSVVVISKALSTLSPEDLQAVAKFFEKPEGKLYWEENIEGASCSSWLKTINRPPYPAMDRDALQRWEKASASLKGQHDRFVRKLNALPKATQTAYFEGAEKLNPIMQQATSHLSNERNQQLAPRLTEILKPKMQELNALADNFKAGKT
jgi:hypothetical protein